MPARARMVSPSFGRADFHQELPEARERSHLKYEGAEKAMLRSRCATCAFGNLDRWRMLMWPVNPDRILRTGVCSWCLCRAPLFILFSSHLPLLRDMPLNRRPNSRRVEAYMREHGPFDVLLGFSQGAILASILTVSEATGA
jgi:hypothetical protein